jgi:hypothetical protein
MNRGHRDIPNVLLLSYHCCYTTSCRRASYSTHLPCLNCFTASGSPIPKCAACTPPANQTAPTTGKWLVTPGQERARQWGPGRYASGR